MNGDQRLHGQPPGHFWATLPSLMEKVVAPVFRGWAFTWKLQASGRKYLEQARQISPAVVFATWHGNLAGFVYTMRDRDMVALVSPVYEGELIARWLNGMGYSLVRGSSGHQPTDGLRAAVRELKNGRDIGSVVDGPEGPAKIVKPGVIAMAKLAGVPIVPGLAASSFAYHFPNWDRHELPLPFSRVRFRFAEPLTIPHDADVDQMEELRLTLERRLIDLDDSLRRELRERTS